MLEQTKLKARRMIKDLQQKLSVESATAIENVYNDIAVLSDFINQELFAIDRRSDLDQKSKKPARRHVFEQAGRKLEAIKAKRNRLEPGKALKEKRIETPAEDQNSLLVFFRQKEVRDRLFGMTETQILSLFGESLFDGSNRLLSNAILNAPPGFEPVSKRTLKKMQQTIRPETEDEFETVQNLNILVEEVFSLAKKELDRLRRKELPAALTQLKNLTDRPFKF